MTRPADLVSLYLGSDQAKWPLPAELCYLILEIAGMCHASKKFSFFYVHCPHLIKNRRNIQRTP